MSATFRLPLPPRLTTPKSSKRKNSARPTCQCTSVRPISRRTLFVLTADQRALCSGQAHIAAAPAGPMAMSRGTCGRICQVRVRPDRVEPIGVGAGPLYALLGYLPPNIPRPANELGPCLVKHITDGTTKTLLVGEYTNIDNRPRGSFWAYTYASYALSQTVTQPRVFMAEYNKCIALGQSGTLGAPNYSTGDRVCKRSWWSMHRGGMNTVMCDGSSDFVSFDIDLNLFASLGSIAGGD